jgi:hypothetical protein
MARKERLWGLLAEFKDPTSLVQAIHQTREAGYRRLDAYSPFPVEEVAEALHFQRTGMPLVMLIGGITGCVGGFLLEYWCMAIDYPFNVGGRPLNSWPMWIPVAFECTVLISAVSGILGLLGLCGLPTPYHPLFHVPQFARATQDRFFLSIQANDPRFDLPATREFLAGLGAVEVLEVPR